MAAQPFLYGDTWIEVKDGDLSGMALFKRHYSARTTEPKIHQFVGPGEKMVLLTPDARALFAWRKEMFRLDDQTGVNCAVFRNEQSAYGRSSELITAAMLLAWERWPGERLFTFVDASKIRHKRDPGRCFMRAGFTPCGQSKSGKLAFEAYPSHSC